ncbi:hypothetical protein [Nocardia wallacei]|uniref:Uncharacterized protein n=1 Tax=Nocardia wallacei TaxID=480035 RepID=A0A7G1KT91_9NOCA|nr:hypothetical protein [Nocardia wallacei]BCK57433.1 hypothetical protein NWFMUON74_52050 [Nocardia wallacei]
MLYLKILAWGLVAGLVNSAAMAVLYGNPWVARIHAADQEANTAGPSAGAGSRNFGAHFLGTQLEVYVVTIGYAWLHPLLPLHGLIGALALALLFAALRTCAPVWALWLRATHSPRYLAVEVAAGVLSSVAITLTLYPLM